MNFKNMKTTFLNITAVTLAITMLQSCLKSNDDYSELVPNAVVTVKPDGNSFYLQLDDETVLYPSNLTKSPFGDKEVRAFTNYKDDKNIDGKKTVIVNWLREMLTQETDESKGSKEADIKEYGNDPVEIINLFPTVCEDGYLTLRFEAPWSRNSAVQHRISLITGTDKDDPYTVVLRHNAFDDEQDVIATSYVSFRLDKLPDTKGETVTLKVKFLSPEGEKTAKFDYKTRPSDSVKE